MIKNLDELIMQTPISNALHIEKGWHKYIIDIPTNKMLETIHVTIRAVVLRYIIPSELDIYGSKKYLMDMERKIGIHRFVIGKEFGKKVETLITKDDVLEILEMKNKVITFDCNEIPYLVIECTGYSEEDLKNYPELKKDLIDPLIEKDNILIESAIKNHIENQPDYTQIFTDVLNEIISPEEAEKLSNKIIYREFLDIEVKI